MTAGLAHSASILLPVVLAAVAAVWSSRAVEALRHMGDVPDLLEDRYAAALPVSEGLQISIIVPARDEEQAIEATLRSLLAIEGVEIEVIAVDDRSSDSTGAIMDRVLAEAPERLRVLHITDLPEGWMGKTHAMALAARHATAPWLLFTDGDVVLRPDTLLRSLNLVHSISTDHFVLYPTLTLKSAGERMMIGLFLALSICVVRPWRVPDPSSRDTIGVGAFNMIRREVYDAIGGYEALRMEVLEDLRLGVVAKHRGYQQRVAFGRDLVQVHWAPGVLGVIHAVRKNLFALFRFKPLSVVGAAIGLAALFLLPFAGLFAAGWSRVFAGVTVGALVVIYAINRRQSGISILYLLTFPIAACLLLYAMAASTFVTLANGGVRWRGTFYPLVELRRRSGPLR